MAKIPLKQYWELLVSYLAPQWPLALLLAVLLLSNIGLQLVNPQIMRSFIDTAKSGGAGDTLWQSALLFMIVALAQQIVSVLSTYVGENVGWTTTNALRADVAEHCLYLDMSFHNAHTPGEMIERIEGDINALSNFFSQFVIQVFGNALLLVGVLFFLFREDWRVGVALSIFAAIALALLWRMRDMAEPHWKAEREASAEQFGFLEERLAGTEDIRSSGAKPYVMRRFFVLMRGLMQKTLKAVLMFNIMLNLIEFLFAASNAVAFAMSAYLFRLGAITIGTVYIIFYYSNMLMMPINRITRQMQSLQQAGASIARIRELLNIKGKIPEGANLPPTTIHIAAGPLAVEFKGVSFGYDDAAPFVKEADDKAEEAGGKMQDAGSKKQEAKPTTEPPNNQTTEPAPKELVLHDISFSLPPGTVLGLLGRTGSGKTTLTRLVFRLYDLDAGEIRLGSNGAAVDIRDVAVPELRQRVGMVTQNIQLFHATVRDNLTFFDATIPDERILQVIHDLGLGTWYESLTNGLDTELESGGGGLSAGEQQLLAFTRIFLKDPGLVILDEASSRLDPATEHLIERAVDRLVQNRTAIIIAHRLGTVQRADQIMILEGGHIREYGQRAALAADPDSRFYSLLQAGMEEVLV
ncbi:MAG TPA: ABC transporter ATP-binding protein [Anaerolineae bacterium]|nr:ABC transporter ATP-binding protein [Anaerolineae bacterium]HQI86299.1 ABC transporter ATP-binding protein [Anaerolineae bacterium]